jgi:hypothetical protein
VGLLVVGIALMAACSIGSEWTGEASERRLAAHGISIDLPPGWDGRISKRKWPLSGQAVVYFASFTLPARDDRPASKALRAMGRDDVLVGLYETPREMGVGSVKPRIEVDARGLLSINGVYGPGDETFVAGGRAFILNSTFGRQHPSQRLIRSVNAVLASLRVAPRKRPLRLAADPAPPRALGPVRLFPTPVSILNRCRRAQARSRFPVLCPARLPRPFIAWGRGEPPALAAEELPAPGTWWRSRSDPRYRKRRFSGVGIGYGAPWEPDSGSDWRRHLWRNHPCCFLHLEVFWRQKGRRQVPAGARGALLGGRRGLLKDASSYGTASQTGDHLYWANHTRFLWEENGVPYVATLHRFGTKQETRALLGRLIRELRPVRPFARPGVGSSG